MSSVAIMAPSASADSAVFCFAAQSTLSIRRRSVPLYSCKPLARRKFWGAADFLRLSPSLNGHRPGYYKLRPFAVSFIPTAGYGGELLHDAGATVLVLAGANVLVFTFDNLTQRNFIEQNLSRKLVHILSGLLFLASWPIFRELLRGPLYYVLVLILTVLIFWRDSPIGVISLAMMCGGDGIADIMGRRYGSLKIPYNKKKSWAGSISMFVFGFLVSIGMLYYFSALGYFQLDWVWTIKRVALVSFIATFVESLPTIGGVDDNISVPLASMVVAMLSFMY